MQKFIWFLAISTCIIPLQHARSVHRKKDPHCPMITVRYEGAEQEFKTIGSHYEHYPLFSVFNDRYLVDYALPVDPIAYRDIPDVSVNGTLLIQQIETLLKDIADNKTTFTHFILLQKKNFNKKRQCGLMVLKFKDYPFVVKLFIEKPNTFFNPYCKGIESVAFFYMAGGANRHITGFTRIKNAEKMKSLYHERSLIYPRKWLWVPDNIPWLVFKGSNIGNLQTIEKKIPSVYAIIADYIDTREVHPLEPKERKSFIMDLCNTFKLFIDPHEDNFVINHTDNGTLSVKVIDTEHFPTLVGLKQETQFRSHYQWIAHLTKKCLHGMYFKTKRTRITDQYILNRLAL